MNSRELLAIADEIIAAFKPDQYIVLLLDRVAKGTEMVLFSLSSIIGTAINSSEHNAVVGKTNTSIAELSKSIANAPPSRTYAAISATQSILQKIEKLPAFEDTVTVGSTTKLLNDFSDAYDRFLQTRNGIDAYNLGNIATDLYTAITTFYGSARMVQVALEPGFQDIKEGELKLSLYLSDAHDLKKFIDKLAAIRNLYSEFCELLNISEAIYPLKVLKLESGSLYTDLVGNHEVIHFILIGIGVAAAYVYRNYVREGKRREIPKDVEGIQALFRLDDEMSKRGMETSALRERILKASVKVADNFNTLLDGEEIVETNKVIHPITPEGQQKLLAGRAVLLLNDGKVVPSATLTPP